MEDIYAKTYRGDYNNSIKYPTDPKYLEKYSILKKNAIDLTDDEIKSIPYLRDNLAKDKEEYDKQVENYRKEDGRLFNLFMSDCAEFFGMKDHPKRPIVESKAWEHGHSSGYSEVVHWYDEFAEVAKYNENK